MRKPIDVTHLPSFLTSGGRTIYAAIRIDTRCSDDTQDPKPILYFVGRDGLPTGFFPYCADTIANRPGAYGRDAKGLCLDGSTGESIDSIQGERLFAYAQGACDAFNAAKGSR